MDASLFAHPLVMAPPSLRASTTPDEAARLRALTPEAYWLEIARELHWDIAPTVALDGVLGDFRYFPDARTNVSVQCLDRWPPDRVALHYEREDGLTETWTTAASPMPPRASPQCWPTSSAWASVIASRSTRPTSPRR